MSVKFKVIRKPEPGVPLGGKRKYYAIVTNNSTVSLRNIAKQISQRSTLSVIDTIAVLEGLLEVIPEQLSLGNQVQLGDLGSVKLVISSEGSEREEDVTSSNIKKSRVVFRPGVIIKKALNNLSFKKR